MNREQLAGILARANEFKEGDLMVGGTRDDLERKEARLALSALRLADIASTALVEDSMSEALSRAVN
jgi:ethanolamine ammonia-lyase large subunit